MNGTIAANGGSSDGGNGGAIRLVALMIDGSGSLSANGGQPGGVVGRIRFEALDNQYTGSINNTPVAQGKPFGIFLPPTPPPSVRINIGGVVVEKPKFTV